MTAFIQPRAQPLRLACSASEHVSRSVPLSLHSSLPAARPPLLRVSQPRAGPLTSSRRDLPPPTATGGGSGGVISGGSGYGGSGGGGGDASWGDSSPDQPKRFVWKGWQARVAADPQFTYKVFIEQVIGVGAAVVGDMASRPNWGLHELDFVFATLVVGSVVNFSLMYLLAPTAVAGAAAAAPASGLVGKLFSEQTLRAWGAPAGNMFEAGFPLHKRAINLVWKGFVFSMVGMAAGIVGTSMSNGLLLLRKKLDPNFESQNAPPNIMANAAAWATHMGLSSNLRYQILGGLDLAVQPRLGPNTFKLLTSLVRTGNNILGGMSFVTTAKILKVQKTAQEAAEEKASQLKLKSG